MDEDPSHIDRLTRWALFDILHLLYNGTNSYKKKRYTKKKYSFHREVCLPAVQYNNCTI